MYHHIQALKKDPLTARVGAPWTNEEESELLNEIKTCGITEIAEKHQRTTGGIRARLALIACDMCKNHGLSIAEASAAVKIDEDILHKKIQRIENRAKRKTDTSPIVMLPEHDKKPKIYTICSGTNDDFFDPKKICAEITIGSKGFKIVESFKPQISVFYCDIKLIGEMSFNKHYELYTVTLQYYNRNKPASVTISTPVGGDIESIYGEIYEGYSKFLEELDAMLGI